MVGKPFSYAELRERVAAVLRRCYRERRGRVLRAGPVTVDSVSRGVDVGGFSVGLSRLEFELLRMLVAEPGRVFTREELMRGVWGAQTFGRSRTLDTHCARLRAKLRAAGGEGLVVNVWGVGYRLEAPSLEAA